MLLVPAVETVTGILRHLRRRADCQHHRRGPEIKPVGRNRLHEKAAVNGFRRLEGDIRLPFDEDFGDRRRVLSEGHEKPVVPRLNNGRAQRGTTCADTAFFGPARHHRGKLGERLGMRRRNRRCRPAGSFQDVRSSGTQISAQASASSSATILTGAPTSCPVTSKGRITAFS